MASVSHVTSRRSDITGKTIRFVWTDGPTKGETHEHVFHDDGTVEWHSIGSRQPDLAPGQPAERPKYAAMPVADDVTLVSYLSRSGYTLTMALNFQDNTVAAIASNATEWHPIHGFLEVRD
jgi:hypothetical protein